ncbi:hypothetical protein ACEUAI_02300 [Aeromonas veronii]
MKRVVVCCPGGVVTGGPELLHQFVDALRARDIDAKILYTPFDTKFNITSAYIKYNISTLSYEDVTDNDVIIIPEVLTVMVNFFKKNKIYLWWLSVDNYFSSNPPGSLKATIGHALHVLRGDKLPVYKLKDIRISHLVQSQYAKDFLAKNSIKSTFLTDYLNTEHLEQEIKFSIKERKIAFNPKKGFECTQKLISKNSDIEFVPIQNMTPVEVRALLQTSMIYIDFGNHPGKDRFPREAAMAGCCIITGRNGSAANANDICIPDEFKLDSRSSSFENDFSIIVKKIMDNYHVYTKYYDKYRSVIASEREAFEGQVEAFVDFLK